MLTCRSLRGTVLTSGLLLIAAWTLEFLAQHTSFAPVSISYIAFLLLIAAPVLLIATVLRSLLPANAARLNECNH
jgi:hypothetical protein